LYRFDGKRFKYYVAEGRGTAMSSSSYDENGRLWCNTFHGDIYYLQRDTLIRHSISELLKEITTFHRVNENLYLQSQEAIYSIDAKTSEIKKVFEDGAILSMFAFNKTTYVLHAKRKELFISDLAKKNSQKVEYLKADGFRIMTITLNGEPHLFFMDSGRIIPAREIFDKQSEVSLSVKYEGKINYVTAIENEIVVCGVNGVSYYTASGVREKTLLPKMQVTHFGKDAEGNCIATTAGNGVILIPDEDIEIFSYENVLDNEYIITSKMVSQNILLHGTNAGKIIQHDLQTDKMNVLDLGLRSEVLSFELSKNKKTLYAYCDGLYTINWPELKAKKRYVVTSIKNIVAHEDELILGSRRGIVVFKNDTIENYSFNGWNLSMLPTKDEQGILISSKKGLFYFQFKPRKLTELSFSNFQSDHNIRDLNYFNDQVYFCYDYQKVFRLSDDRKTIDLVYRHDVKNLSGMGSTKKYLTVFLKDTVLYVNRNGEVVRCITKYQGLNESQTHNIYHFQGKDILVHRNSLTIFDGLPAINRERPSLSYNLSAGSTFYVENDMLTSDYNNNNLSLELIFAKAIRSRGSLKVFYKINKTGNNWIQTENPYSPVNFERLPIGQGKILLKAQNEDGIFSQIVEIPYRVKPPFYLSSWFILLCVILLIVFVILIVRWRVNITRRKALERLRKKQLETRALNAELTAIRSQMNPHFIFNVLTAIQAKVIEGKSDEAYENIGDFAELIRNVLEKSGREYIFLKEEIALMRNYVELENSRLTDPIELQIAIEDEEFFDDILIPTLITQPIIENAIKHAFPTEHKSKEIRLDAKRTTSGFIISIVDNGIGFDQTSKTKADHKSFALEAMEKRIRTLSEQANYQIELTINSSENGTAVKFTFTYK
jgi:anti-sigma regulatory factor (Ser/Thr protein kinase)